MASVGRKHENSGFFFFVLHHLKSQSPLLHDYPPLLMEIQRGFGSSLGEGEVTENPSLHRRRHDDQWLLALFDDDLPPNY